MGTALLASTVAYGFARFRFPGKGVLFGTVVVGLTIPTTMLIIPQFLLAKDLGLLSSLPGRSTSARRSPSRRSCCGRSSNGAARRPAPVGVHPDGAAPLHVVANFSECDLALPAELAAWADDLVLGNYPDGWDGRGLRPWEALVLRRRT